MSKSRSAHLLGVIAAVCLVAGLLPSRRKYTDTRTNEEVAEFRMGITASPIWEYQRRESPRGFQSSGGFRFLSWSTILAVTGAGLLQLSRRIGGQQQVETRNERQDV